MSVVVLLRVRWGDYVIEKKTEWRYDRMGDRRVRQN